MTINERVRYIRNDLLGMNQRQFAKSIGMGQSGLSSLERGECAVTDRVIKTVCSVFHINEEWLRTGGGEMYDRASTFSLDRFAADHGATELELEIVKAYFEMPVDLRQAVLEHFKDYFSGEAEGGTDNAEAAYEKTLESLRNTDSTASNTTAEEEEA